MERDMIMGKRREAIWRWLRQGQTNNEERRRREGRREGRRTKLHDYVPLVQTPLLHALSPPRNYYVPPQKQLGKPQLDTRPLAPLAGSLSV